MNIAQRIITGLAATALALAPIPEAKASTPQRYSTQTLIEYGVNPTMAHAVEALGVPVFDGGSHEICERTADGYFYGLYNYNYNVIVMCSNNLPNRYEFVETFTHEVVHLIQDCRAGLDNTVLRVSGNDDYIMALWSRLPEAKQFNILNSYDHTDWDIEIEAFYFETKPITVKNELIDVCF